MDLYGTLGASCARRDILTRMFQAGMTGLRLNLSHTTLAECNFPWEEGREYQLELRLEGEDIVLSIDGAQVLSVRDTTFDHGMFGCGSLHMGRTAFRGFSFREL